MSKRIISIITTIVLILTMMVPAMAGNGDNAGEDNTPCSVLVSNSALLGEYTLGSEKIFKISTYASTSIGSIVNRKLEITGDYEVSKIEFLDGDTWKDISEYNQQITLANDLNRQIRVVFETAGKYTIRFSLTDTSGVEIAYSQRVVNVSDAGIELYKESETTTEEVTTTTPETTTEEVTTTVPETTTEEVTTATPVTTTVQETTTATQTTPQATTTAPQATTVKNVRVPKAKIVKAAKKKSAKKAKITLKRLRNITGYQVQVSRTTNFKSKNVIVKSTKKTIFTIKKLKAGKKYYVRVRAFVKVKKIKRYGEWSKIRSIKFTK